MYLDNNMLTGPLPLFEKCENLDILVLHNNPLDAAIPSEWSAFCNANAIANNAHLRFTFPSPYLPSLTQLNLRNTGLRATLQEVVDAFGVFGRLTQLFLSDNKITGHIPNLSSDKAVHFFMDSKCHNVSDIDWMSNWGQLFPKLVSLDLSNK